MQRRSMIIPRESVLGRNVSIFAQSPIRLNHIKDEDSFQDIDTLAFNDVYEENDPTSQPYFLYSVLQVQNIMQDVVKGATKLMVDNHQQRVIPYLAIESIRQQIEQALINHLTEWDDTMTDLVDQGLVDEPEPRVMHDEHWASFKVEVGTKYVHNTLHSAVSKKRKGSIRSPLRPSASNSTSNLLPHSTVKLSNMGLEDQKRRTDESEIDIQPIEQVRLQSLTDLPSEEEDPLENGMRIAYEREQQLQRKAIKEKAERQREEEIKENQRQMRQIQNSITGKKAYTYDFEGKLIIQNGVKEQPHMSDTVGFSVQSLGVPPERKAKESKPEPGHVGRPAKKEIVTPSEMAKQYSTVSQVENIILEKGVTIFEGGAQKSGPKYLSETLHTLGELELSYHLSNPLLGLKLSKQQYDSIIIRSSGTQHTQSTRVLKPDGNNTSMASQVNHTEMLLQDSINTSILPKQRQRYYVTNSLNSSASNLKAGLIRHYNDSQSSIDELFDHRPPSYHPPSHRRLPAIAPAITPNEQFSLDLLQNPEWGATKESQPKHRTRLPTKIQSTHSLPQLPKNPRERLHSMAQLSVTKSKHLPPPNVGNVMGHNYKGVKLTNII